MSATLRVGTRSSALALRQTTATIRALSRHAPGVTFEIVPMRTHGDRDQRVGISPDFTGALEQALRSRAVDLAVHSAKDLAATDPTGLCVAAYPRRADPRDCLIARRGHRLPTGARIGSSSLRRRAQLLRWRADLQVKEVRGNVDTRIRLVRDRELDAIVVAKAGIERLGRGGEISQVLSVKDFLPAPAQGAIAVQVRRADSRARSAVARIDHEPTRAAVEAERALAAALGASCNLPLGARAVARSGRLRLDAEVLSGDGTVTLRACGAGPVDRARALGRSVARQLRSIGAGELIERAR